MKQKKSFTKWLAVLLMAIMMCSSAMSVAAAGKTYPTVDMFKDVSLKGVQGAQSSSSYGGLDHTLTNVFLDAAIFSPDSDWAKKGWVEPYVFEGETFYFGDSPEGMGLVPLANERGMSVSVVFLLRWRTDSHGNDSAFLIDPDSRDEGYLYYAPNADLTTYGGRAIRAYWHFLMEWLTDNGYHIDNFILGNEVNMPNQWHYSGNPDSGDVHNTATKYANAFYYMWNAVKKYTTVSRCSVCVDHSWQNDNEGWGTAAKDFLHVFNDRLEEIQTGIDWCVSTHMYPAQLFDPEIWNDPHNLAPNDSSARIIDGSNLSIMTNYIRETWGPEHRVMLTEQGFCDDKGAEIQAASLAYSYYVALYDPMVDCFILSVEDAGTAYTSEGEKSMDFRIAGTLAGEVYTKIDNGNAADQQWIADTCLPVIGVESWADIVPNFGGSTGGDTGVDTSLNGLLPAEDGNWYYYVNGVVDTNYTGLMQNEFGWWYVEKGVLNFNYNGFVLYNDVWWCVAGGRVAFDYTGLWCDPVVGWWYVENGTINFNYNGLIPYDGAWWCVAGGAVVFDYTGLWCDPNVGWWYVENGAINFGFTGLVGNELGWWYVQGGTINFDYIGLTTNEFGTWLVYYGGIPFDYTGPYVIDGVTYQIAGGLVVG